MMGYENYRASENEDDFWISHLGSWVDDGAMSSKGKYIILVLILRGEDNGLFSYPKFEISMKYLCRNVY